MSDFHDNWTKLYSSLEVQKNLDRMAVEMSLCTPSDKPLTLITILKGGLWTAYHLLYRLAGKYPHPDIRIGHMGLSSYGNGRVPGEMKVTSTLDLDIKDLQDTYVWLIDDIWHTGQTLEEAKKRIKLMGAEIRGAGVLVFRNQGPSPAWNGPGVYGFQYGGPEFLAGCGMGIGELHRHHPEIYREKNHGTSETSSD
jgi:hypoxanthine-guanine phosphoribosyltransferase